MEWSGSRESLTDGTAHGDRGISPRCQHSQSIPCVRGSAAGWIERLNGSKGVSGCNGTCGRAVGVTTDISSPEMTPGYPTSTRLGIFHQSTSRGEKRENGNQKVGYKDAKMLALDIFQ